MILFDEMSKDKPIQIFNNFADYPKLSKFTKSYFSEKAFIYKGKSTVSSGNFSFSLKVPKDIDYTYGNSRMSFYVENGNIDGNGNYESLIIGGINSNAPNDITGPEIKLYLNDENFVSGGISNNNPVLIAHLL